MRARVPQDVDLEDKLIYGLTPARLGYLVISLLAALALWSSDWSADAVRLPSALLVVGMGAASAWGRFRDRPLDSWAVDFTLFVARNFTVSYEPGWRRALPQECQRPESKAHSATGRSSRTVLVVGASVDAVTMVAVELSCLLATRGEPTLLADAGAAALRLGMVGTGRHPATGLELAPRVSDLPGRPSNGPGWQVVVVDAAESATQDGDCAELQVVNGVDGWVCTCQRAGSELRVTIPRDPVIEIASELREPTVLIDPESAASRVLASIAQWVSSAE